MAKGQWSMGSTLVITVMTGARLMPSRWLGPSKQCTFLQTVSLKFIVLQLAVAVMAKGQWSMGSYLVITVMSGARLMLSRWLDPSKQCTFHQTVSLKFIVLQFAVAVMAKGQWSMGPTLVITVMTGARLMPSRWLGPSKQCTFLQTVSLKFIVLQLAIAVMAKGQWSMGSYFVITVMTGARLMFKMVGPL